MAAAAQCCGRLYIAGYVLCAIVLGLLVFAGVGRCLLGQHRGLLFASQFFTNSDNPPLYSNLLCETNIEVLDN